MAKKPNVVNSQQLIEKPEASGVQQARGKPASKNPFGAMAKKHAGHLNKAQGTALADIIEAAKNGAAADETAIATYVAAFKAEVAKLWNEKPQVAAVYATERKTILTAWNVSKDGKVFSKTAIAEKWGYNKVKREARKLVSKPRRPQARTEGNGTSEPESQSFSEIMEEFDSVIAKLAGFGFNAVDDFAERSGSFRDYLFETVHAKAAEVVVAVDSEGQQVLAIAA